MASAFHGWGLDGGNASPDLGWTGKPAGTKSLALTVFDPDAPTGIGFWHWVCFNIPGSADGVPAGAGAADQKLGPWINGLTDYGKVGYNGPCPPKGDKPHHYIVTVYALDIDKLDLGSDTTPAMLKFFLRDHVLAQGTLTGTFQR
jgi:Raf kinase inhibitor-like YbhB/YbcL family protein